MNTQTFNNPDRLTTDNSQLTPGKSQFSTNLSPREKEIVHLIAYEYSSKEIANLLHVSSETIKTHRKNIQYKFGVKNVAGIVRVAFERKVLSLDQLYQAVS